MANLGLVSQPSGPIPIQSQDPMCWIYDPTGYGVNDNCKAKYRLTIGGCEVFNGALPVIDKVTDLCAGTTSDYVNIDVRGIVSKFWDIGIKESSLTNLGSDLVVHNPKAHTTVEFEAAICCNGEEGIYDDTPSVEVVFSSISADDGYEVEKYFFPYSRLTSFEDVNVLAVAGDVDTNLICLEAGDLTQGRYYIWHWVPVPESYSPGAYTLTVDVSIDSMGVEQTITISDPPRGVIGVDISTLVASLAAFANGLTTVPRSSISAQFKLRDNTTPLEFDMGVWEAYWDRNCCDTTVMQFVNEFGVFDYMSLSSERAAGVEKTLSEYLSAATCNSLSRKRRFAGGRTSRSYTFYTKPFSPSQKNFERIVSFLQASEFYWPAEGKTMYLEPSLSVTVEKGSGRIQLPITFFEEHDKPVLVNRL